MSDAYIFQAALKGFFLQPVDDFRIGHESIRNLGPQVFHLGADRDQGIIPSFISLPDF